MHPFLLTRLKVTRILRNCVCLSAMGKKTKKKKTTLKHVERMTDTRLVRDCAQRSRAWIAHIALDLLNSVIIRIFAFYEPKMVCFSLENKEEGKTAPPFPNVRFARENRN